jgi:hypothetical protein
VSLIFSVLISYFLKNLPISFIKKDITEEGSNKSVVQGYFIANSCNLGLEFLYNTFFKTGKKLR